MCLRIWRRSVGLTFRGLGARYDTPVGALRLDAEPIELKAGRRLDFCWGVAIWDGNVEADAIAAFYRDWLIETAPRDASGAK